MVVRLGQWRSLNQQVADSFHALPEHRVIQQHEKLIANHDVKTLSRLCPLRSTGRIALEWLLIALTVMVAHRLSGFSALVVAIVVIGSRQHALLMLLHEGVHGRLHPNKWVNQWISDLLLAFPFFVTYHGFAREHLTHHRLLGNSNDPEFLMKERLDDYQFPKSRSALLWSFIRHAIGWNTIREYALVMVTAQYSLRVPTSVNIARIIYYLSIGGLVVWLGLAKLYVLYWILPMTTYLVFALYCRLVAEHFGLHSGIGGFETRTVVPGPFERFFLSPVNISYHTEHHLYPSVPYYNLVSLHSKLMKSPAFKRKVHLTRGYTTGLISELLSNPARPKVVQPAKIRRVD